MSSFLLHTLSPPVLHIFWSMNWKLFNLKSLNRRMCLDLPAVTVIVFFHLHDRSQKIRVDLPFVAALGQWFLIINDLNGPTLVRSVPWQDYESDNLFSNPSAPALSLIAAVFLSQLSPGHPLFFLASLWWSVGISFYSTLSLLFPG